MDYQVISSHIQSSVLGARRGYRLLLPERRAKEPLPLFILLHGVHGTEVDWTEKGDLVNTLNTLSVRRQIGPMAVLTPSDGLRSIGTGYLNWDTGESYEDHFLKELVPIIEKEWNVGGKRSRRAIGGLSMGGYAAIRLAIQYPQLFISASSLSGFFDVAELGELIGMEDYRHIFSLNQEREVDVSPLTMPIVDKDKLPELLFDCGVQDKYIEMNREIHDRLSRINKTHCYEEHQGGHTWDYWTTHVKQHFVFHNSHFNK